MSDNDNVRARQIVQEIHYITIATVTANGHPWNTPVYAAYDGNYNFFWASDREAQHSINIQNQPQIFLAIYDSRVPEGTGEGVYIQAVAGELSDADAIRHGLALLGGRVGKPPEDPQDYLRSRPRRVYRAAAQRSWINSEGSRGGEYIDIRIPVTLVEESPLR